MDRCVKCVDWSSILRAKELSINAHQQTQPKNRPSHNQYSNPADLLPPPFGSSLIMMIMMMMIITDCDETDG